MVLIVISLSNGCDVMMMMMMVVVMFLIIKHVINPDQQTWLSGKSTWTNDTWFSQRPAIATFLSTAGEYFEDCDDCDDDPSVETMRTKLNLWKEPIGNFVLQ